MVKMTIIESAITKNGAVVLIEAEYEYILGVLYNFNKFELHQRTVLNKHIWNLLEAKEAFKELVEEKEHCK